MKRRKRRGFYRIEWGKGAHTPPPHPHPTPGLKSNWIDGCRSLEDDETCPASLRSDGDRLHPGTVIAIRSESLIGFAGIRNSSHCPKA